MSLQKTEVPIRIRVANPPDGIAFAVQRGRGDLLLPNRIDRQGLVFEFSLTASSISAADLRITGAFAQGTPRSRFVYLNSGTLAGQSDSCWTRRAKVPVTGITQSQVKAVLQHPGAVLEATVQAIAKDGGPACGSIELQSAWRVSGAAE